MGCPDDRRLLEYADDQATGDRDPTLASHLADCPTCRAKLEALSPHGSTQAYGAGEEPFLARGTVVGRYIVLEHLGSGGMGIVYTAYDPELDRKIALKLIRTVEANADSETSRLRLLREAQAMARVAHPNVVHVYDVGLWNERVFVAMELVDGETLGRWLRREHQWRQALALLVEAGRGLAAAHAAGLVHRDFKPDNVLVSRDGRARVTDFGLARPPGPAGAPGSDAAQSPSRLHQRLTHTGALVGTPAYMAPEQLHGDPSDARADVFSFCVALYEALYGERPFKASSVVEQAAQIAKGQIAKEPVETTVPARLRAIVLRGLRADPSQRFASMDALLRELTWEPAARRGRWLALVGAVAAVTLVVGGVALRRLDRRVCNDGRAQLTGVWDDARLERTREAFLATRLPYAATTFKSVQHELDRFTDAWRAMHLEACEATRVRGDQSPELLDLRMECLDKRRRELGATTDLFSRADANVVEHALAVTSALGGVEPCADGKSLRAAVRTPADPRLKLRTDALRDRMAAARALSDAGKLDDAAKAVPPLVTEARALNDGSLEAETLLLLGEVQLKNGQSDAERTLKDAELAAEASPDDRTAARAWIQLIELQNSTVVENQAAADESARHAEAYLARLPGDDRDRIALWLALGHLDADKGRFAESSAAYRRALTAARRVYGDEHPLVAECLEHLGLVVGLDEGTALSQQAVAINEKVLGAEHPQTARSYFSLAAVSTGLTGGSHNDAAIAAYRRGIAIFEKTYGPESPSVAFGLSRLADVLGDHGQPGDFAESLVLQKRAIAIYRAKNPTGRDVGRSLALLGGLYINDKEYDRALAALDEAQAILEPLGKTGPYLGWMVYRLRGKVLRSAGRYAEAVKAYEQALTTKIDADSVREVKFELAQSLWETGRAPARTRAVALAVEVRPLFAAAKGVAHQRVDEIDQWLHDHHAP